jgi:hypothetical protein
MKNVNVINAPKNAVFLKDFMTELPAGLFDKGKTGCGGTELAISNDKDIIILMPYKSLIKNKKAQHGEEVIAVFGKSDNSEKIQPATDSEIIHYALNKNKRKFLVTYDSFVRLVQLLQSAGIPASSTFDLLIDEWHILFNSYIFRHSAIRSVLETAPSFKKVTYMTATPIEDELILEELKDIKITRIKWSNIEKVKMTPIPSKSPMHTVVKHIKEALEGKIFGNLHFFVNSVSFIAEAIKQSGLKPSLVKVVCSNDKHLGKGNKSNQSKLGDDYLIEESLDPAKKINFYTSTCFEGCDIYDENGRTIIVSDRSKRQTLVDISTLGIQICGRIRNSKYNREVQHIFTESRYIDVTLEEFIESTNKAMSVTEKWVNSVNSQDEEIRKITINLFKRNQDDSKEIKYATVENNYIKLDKNLLKIDIMNFKVINHLYSSRITLQNEYEKNDFTLGKAKPDTDKLKADPKAKISFKKLFIEYEALRLKGGITYTLGNIDDRKILIEKERPLIKEAYEKLGAKRVKELNYVQTNIKRELIKITDASKRSKLKMILDKELPKMTYITGSDVKKKLQTYYDLLGITEKPKATILLELYDAKKKTMKVNNKSVDHFIIIRDKIL